MTSNMYRVGDYVYFECVPNNPYQIRRIEELNKMANGSVEVKVTCFFRRRDLPDHLISMADKYETAYSLEVDDEILSTKQKHQLKLRELFISRQIETLPATHIRGKCCVTFLNETESLLSYLNCDDSFFYLFVYDPTVKTLTADRGEIRVGDEYQAEIPPMNKESYMDTRYSDNEEMLVWTPKHNLTDEYIDKFLVVARSIGTFARALDCSSSVKQPSLHMTAAAASRDITLFHAMNTLHKHGYNISEAANSLIPSTGPALCRDELEEWSAAETNLFEQAMQKYKKNFKIIRNEFLSWKSLKSIVEYYYMWKTTDRYVQQKRAKALEAESKLKQVFIPNYDKPNLTSWNNNPFLEINGKHCDSCSTVKSLQWYSWDLTPTQCILCHDCWCYWKKYGGLKISNKSVESEEKSIADEEQGNSRKLNKCNATGCSKEFKVKSHLIRHYNIAHGCDLRPGSRRPIMKTRTSFYLSTKPFHKLSRRLCQSFIIPQHIARRPFLVINVDAIKQAFQKEIASKSMSDLHDMRRLKRVNRDSLTNIVDRIWSWHSQKFIPPDRNNISRMDRKSYMKVNENSYQESVSNPDLERIQELGVKRKLSQEVSKADNRQYDEILNKKNCRNSLQDEPISSQNAFLQLNGKSRVAAIARKKVVSLAGGSDDVYFKATSKTRNIRRRYSITILRRAARRPWRELIPKCLDETVVILD